MKLTIIGGGSPYMTSMFATLARYAADGTFKNMDIVLHDIDEVNVKQMCEWAQAGVKNDAVPLNFSYDMNLDRSLKGADFVLSCIRPGGLESRHYDESIALKYRQLAIETVGVGGVFMGLRTIPVVVKIAEAIIKNCPNAWLINYTNPTNMVTDATIRTGHVKTVGLCDGVFGIKWLMARLLGIPTTKAQAIEASIAGVNHCTWTMEMSYKGRDLYKELDALIDKADLSGPAGYQCEADSEFLDQVQADACRLYKYFGIIPGSVYYARYYYALEKTMNHLLEPGKQTRAQWLQDIAKKKREEIDSQLSRKNAHIVAYDAEDSAHGDQAVGVMAMIASNAGKHETVNVVNNGSVPNLPNDAIVETDCIVSSTSVTPLANGALPLAVEGIVQSAYAFGKLTVDAALSGNRNFVVQAAMAHPAHCDLDKIEIIIDELFKVHAPYLPQFN